MQKELAAAKAKVDARKQAARVDFAEWLKTAKAEDFAGKIPTTGLMFHAPLKEGKGKSIATIVNGKDRTIEFDGGYDWAALKNDKTHPAFTIRTGKAIELKEVRRLGRSS